MNQYDDLYEEFKIFGKSFMDHFPPMSFIYHSSAITYLSSDKIIQLLLSIVNLKRDPTEEELEIFKKWIEKYQSMRKDDYNQNSYWNILGKFPKMY